MTYFNWKGPVSPGKFRGVMSVDIHHRNHPHGGRGWMESEDEDDDRKESCASLHLSQDSIPVMLLTETSIHGVKYIAQEGRSWVERLFWLIAFMVGLGSSVYLIHGVWARYYANPVIVRFANHEQKTSSIPFPAVTICNNNLVSKRFATQLTRQMNISGNVSGNELFVLRRLCRSQKGLLQEYDEVKGLKVNRDFDEPPPNSMDDHHVDHLMLNYILEGSVPCSDIFRYCKFGGRNRSCDQIFQSTVTAYGKCCTFNMLPLKLLLKNGNFTNVTDAYFDSSHWLSNPSWYEEWSKWDYETHDIELPSDSRRPWKQKMPGVRYGLSLILDANIDDYYCHASDAEGFSFTLHSPLELPSVSQYSSAIHLGKEVRVDVEADITKAEDDIREFTQVNRKCAFREEMQLNLYGPYTRDNCIDECIARQVAVNCSCKVLHLPETYTNMNLTYCLYLGSDMRCRERVEVSVQDALETVCAHCDPLCRVIQYAQQTTMANLKENASLSGEIVPRERHEFAVVHFYFGSESAVPRTRKPLYGLVDLIANTGGILGLCLGFSVLSGVEVVYFLTLRAICKRWKARSSSSSSVTRNGIMGASTTKSQRVSQRIQVCPLEYLP